MSEGRGTTGRWPTAGEAALAVLAAVVVLVIALGGAERSRSLSIERRAASDREVLGDMSVAVVSDLERAVDLVGDAAAAKTVSSVGEAQTSSGSSDAVLVGSVSDVFAEDGLGGVKLVDREQNRRHVSALLASATDTGDAQLSGPVETASGPRLLIAAATYGAGETPIPTTAIDRRARSAGWFVSAVDPAAVLQEHRPAGIDAAVADGSTTFGPDVSDVASLPSQSVDVHSRELVISAASANRVPATAPTIALVLGGLLTAAAAAAAILSVGRRLREQRAEVLRSTDQVRLITDAAPLVQQSLELADVLPAVAVQLSDHFELAGIQLSSGSSTLGQVEMFGIGARPVGGASAKAVLTPPDVLLAGDSLTLALQRAGRSVALLHLVAGRDLDSQDLQSLRAITELITAAVVNASLYASQQEAVRRLREVDALKTVFLSTASHELRTPATAIGGFASLLAGSWDRFDDTQKREFAERIAANARSLAAVVQDLLDFSLLDRGQLDMGLSEVDLEPLVRSVVDRLSPVLPEHEVVCQLDSVPAVAGNSNGLERVVTNLLTNAAKFSPPGSRITMGLEERGGVVAILVCDEGAGVPVEDRDRIFTRFYRGSGEAVLQTRGVGIGLSVVAELTERMGGQVAVDDAPGGGARFTVLLPIAAVAAEPMEAQDATTA